MIWANSTGPLMSLLLGDDNEECDSSEIGVRPALIAVVAVFYVFYGFYVVTDVFLVRCPSDVELTCGLSQTIKLVFVMNRFPQ